MTEENNLPRPPSFTGSKIIAFVLSAVLYSGLLFLLLAFGLGAIVPPTQLSPVRVGFTERLTRTPETETKKGEPEKPPSPEEEPVLPPRPAPEAPKTEVNTGGQGQIPSAPKAETPPIIAAGSSGSGGDSIIGDRTEGGRKEGIAHHGGSAAGENSVKAALRWLAAHQDADGKWSVLGYGRHCPPDDICGGMTAAARAETPGTYDVAATALVTLAFLGHGETHRDGEYRDVVSRALSWLRSQQVPRSGRFSRDSSVNMYNQAIATLALAEAYAMTKDPDLREPVVRALGFICQTQQRSGGWDYTEARSDRNDTSVTGWQVMALKSAHVCGVDVPWKTTWGMLQHFERVTDEEGYVGYTGAPTSRQGIALVAVGMLSNEYLGLGRTHPTVEKQAKLMLADLPAWHKLRGRNGRDHSEYYWYYGTLAMYQRGGVDWEKWNGAIRDMLVRAQCAEGHKSGSWDPDGYWARTYAGRVYMTALMTLTLEVYYRYLPMYESKDMLNAGAALVEMLKVEENPSAKIALLRRLALYKNDEVPGLLRGLMSDANPSVRFASAKALADLGEADAIPVLVKGLDDEDAFVRFSAILSLEGLDHLDTIPALIHALSDAQAANSLRASQALERKTGVRLGFEQAKTPEEKRKIIASWEDWWKNNGARLSRLPDAVGSVVAARDNGKRVLIKVEPEDILKKDMLLKVYRSGVPVGHVQVVEVLKGGMAEASVTRWEPAGSSIRQGDRVATRELPAENK